MPVLSISLPDDLDAAVQRLAERDERSRPAEVRYLLKQAIAQAETTENHYGEETRNQ